MIFQHMHAVYSNNFTYVCGWWNKLKYYLVVSILRFLYVGAPANKFWIFLTIIQAFPSLFFCFTTKRNWNGDCGDNNFLCHYCLSRTVRKFLNFDSKTFGKFNKIWKVSYIITECLDGSTFYVCMFQYLPSTYLLNRDTKQVINTVGMIQE